MQGRIVVKSLGELRLLSRTFIGGRLSLPRALDLLTEQGLDPSWQNPAELVERFLDLSAAITPGELGPRIGVKSRWIRRLRQRECQPSIAVAIAWARVIKETVGDDHRLSVVDASCRAVEATRTPTIGEPEAMSVGAGHLEAADLRGPGVEERASEADLPGPERAQPLAEAGFGGLDVADRSPSAGLSYDGAENNQPARGLGESDRASSDDGGGLSDSDRASEAGLPLFIAHAEESRQRGVNTGLTGGGVVVSSARQSGVKVVFVVEWRRGGVVIGQALFESPELAKEAVRGARKGFPGAEALINGEPFEDASDVVSREEFERVVAELDAFKKSRRRSGPRGEEARVMAVRQEAMESEPAPLHYLVLRNLCKGIVGGNGDD